MELEIQEPGGFLCNNFENPSRKRASATYVSVECVIVNREVDGGERGMCYCLRQECYVLSASYMVARAHARLFVQPDLHMKMTAPRPPPVGT